MINLESDLFALISAWIYPLYASMNLAIKKNWNALLAKMKYENKWVIPQ